MAERQQQKGAGRLHRSAALKDIGRHQLSKPGAGVDSIIESILLEQPDFNHPQALREQIEEGLTLFIRYITLMLSA